MVNFSISQAFSTPVVLQQIADPPKQLYIKGAYNETKRFVAIVGSRKATSEGIQIAHELAYNLANNDIVVVSGLARGIDEAAHRGALEAKATTIAVLPSGIETIYPANHFTLAKQILNSGGALISETGGKYLPQKHDFLKRNRIISGLCEATIVVEAAMRSGALSTARHALEQGREVIAVPGSINSPLSVGCNQLISQGATPITQISDIFHIFSINQKQRPIEELLVSDAERLILKLLTNSAMSQESLATLVPLPANQFLSTLSNLEIEGYIKRAPGNYIYRKQ